MYIGLWSANCQIFLEEPAHAQIQMGVLGLIKDPGMIQSWWRCDLSVEMIFRILCNDLLQDISYLWCQKLLQLVHALHGEALYPRRITSYSDSDIEIKPVSPQVL